MACTSFYSVFYVSQHTATFIIAVYIASVKKTEICTIDIIYEKFNLEYFVFCCFIAVF